MPAVMRPLKWPPIYPVHHSLVLALPFDDRSGSQLLDRSGKRNVAAIVGPSWLAGKRGSALKFNGSSDYVKITDADVLSSVGGSLSISVLLRLASYAGSFMIVSKELEYYLWRSGNKLVLALRDATGSTWRSVTSTVNWEPTLNTWMTITGVFNQSLSTGYVYQNGLEIGSNGAVATMSNRATDLYLGCYEAASLWLQGQIAGLHIHNDILSPSEVKRLSESELLLVRH